jgi:hypothetical protein
MSPVPIALGSRKFWIGDQLQLWPEVRARS